LKSYGAQNLKTFTGWRGALSRNWRYLLLALFGLNIYWPIKAGVLDREASSLGVMFFCIGIISLIGALFSSKYDFFQSKRSIYHSGFITGERMVFLDESLGLKSLEFAKIEKAAFDYENGGKALTITSRGNREYVLVGNFDYVIPLGLIEPRILT
jgi:hypothetical protein